jgi:hypothetical protein
MKKLTLMAAIVLVLVSTTAVWAASVTPTVIPGAENTNKTCAVVMPGTIEFKIEPVPDGNYTKGDGVLSVNITKPSTLAGSLNSFDFTANIPVLGVIVKDGVDGANFYDYSPAGTTGDTYLTTPFDGDKGISHISFCYEPFTPDPQVEVTKTAFTSFTRTHDWEIAKSVDPLVVYLSYPDGVGSATWYIDVTYNGYTDSDWMVYGDITVKNTGNIPARVDSVTDDVGILGVTPTVTCDEVLPHTLDVGEELECSYEAELLAAEDGLNTATATGDFLYPGETVYSSFSEDGTANFVFGAPTTEVHATVDVEDLSDLLGLQLLGTLNAGDFAPGDVEQFTYDYDFSYTDFADCGLHDFDNTASVIGDEGEVLDFDDATVVVNVQCLIFVGETAWAANGYEPLELPYNPGDRRNWATYVEYAEKTTTLFAGRTIDVGTVHFSADMGGYILITVSLTGGWEFDDVAENLKVQDYEFAPSGNPEPGQFEHKKDCNAALLTCVIEVPLNNFYGVHVEVGQWMPDPNFP